MLEDQSVEKIIQNIKSSQLSIKELMEYYLDRIEKYNTGGVTNKSPGEKNVHFQPLGNG